ncbi:Plasmodium vivax Vir protein, putative [Plasmodium vivax]|uniref:Vir protein, putative n=1 Tax=Plasmodium vivax TaxID=5855 RepID=A0A1G4E8N9_PLAVI|nr:Plasmodium vivax Vir protein, putative [Plasmodium vivax]
MSSAQPDPKYFPYSTYAHFKNKFNPYYGIKYDENKLDVFIKKSINRNIEELKYKDVFKELLRHLANTNAISFDDTDAACKYVSYILRKKIQEVDKETYNDNIFSVFKKFAQAFKDDQGFINEQCETKMVNIDSSIFPKMKALYDLYDMYYNIQATPDYKETERCQGLGNFIRVYNTALETYDNTDDYVIKKLLEIKNITDKIKLLPRVSCPYQLSEFESPILYLNRLQREKEALALKEKLQKEKELAQERERQERTNQELSGTRGAFSIPEDDASPEALKNQRESEPSRQLEHAEQVFTDSPLFSLGTSREQTEKLDPSRVRIYAPENADVHEGVTPGVFGSLPSSISSFIRDVEPGPVLAVSGGMGALFLLFKYTPVGSSFGGRRGRFRQIPRTFNGPFPGDFPNFNEYEGGYIGYSPMSINPLAE